MASRDQAAAQGHEDEWNITYEHVDPNDPLVAWPRWRDALQKIAEADEREGAHIVLARVKQIAKGALGDA